MSGNSLTLETLRFLNQCEGAQFDSGSNVHFQIRFSNVIGAYYTTISDDDGGHFSPIHNESGTLFFETFAAALNSIVEHKREM